jgi:hypothetical protein
MINQPADSQGPHTSSSGLSWTSNLRSSDLILACGYLRLAVV